jgi:hypothetical protein
MGWNSPRAQRQVMDDELTLHNRGDALKWGFWAFAIGGGALFAASRLPGDWVQPGLPVLVSAPLSVVMLRFTWLEREAAKDD